MQLFFKYLYLYLTFILTTALSACQQPQSQPQLPILPTPLPQDDRIQVYTNHSPAASYTEPYRPNQMRSGDDLEQVIVETIATAKSTLDVAVQEFRLPKIAAALAERQRAGVKVRVILENTYAKPFSQFTEAQLKVMPQRERDRIAEYRQLADRDRDGNLSQTEIEQGDALVVLDRAQIPRLDDTADGSAGSNLMHHKFLVVDGRMTIVTSANFTPSDVHGDFRSPSSRGNANNLLKIASPELAALFTQEFNLMWGDGVGNRPDSKFGTKKLYRPSKTVTIGTTKVEVQFSPTTAKTAWEKSSNGLISRTLTTATQSIAMALFVLSDQRLVNALEPIHNKGVEIKTLIDPGFAYRSYSEALDMMGIVLAEDCKLEAGNRVWQPPIATVGVPKLLPGDLLHHKFGIVDQQIVITGSHNWTDAANLGNDETVLIVHNSTVAAHYQREFDRLYSKAILGIPPAIQRKVDAQKQECPQFQTRSSKPRSSKPRSPSQQLPKSSSAKQQSVESATKAEAVSPSKSTDQTQPNQRVNLNTATQAELETLPGVGAKLAVKIIAARQKKPFATLEEFDRVPGVNRKLLEGLKDRVTW